MRCQFFETPKKKYRAQLTYTRNQVRLRGFKHLDEAVSCHGKMKVRVSVSHDGGYGSCSYDLEIQYYCDTCKRVFYEEGLPRTSGEVEKVLQDKIDRMNDFDFDKFADAIEKERLKRERGQIEFFNKLKLKRLKGGRSK